MMTATWRGNSRRRDNVLERIDGTSERVGEGATRLMPSEWQTDMTKGGSEGNLHGGTVEVSRRPPDFSDMTQMSMTMNT
jgi:hypothetical protein